jgi:hypothetical protein
MVSQNIFRCKFEESAIIGNLGGNLGSIGEVVNMTSEKPSDSGEILGVPDVAKELHYSERYVRDLLNSGGLKGRRLRERGKWMITRKDLEEFQLKHALIDKPADEPTKHTPDEAIGVQSNERSNDDILQHDKKIFEDSDAILNEGDVRQIVNGLSSSCRLESDMGIKLGRIREFFSFEGNQYISDAVNTKCKNLTGAIDKLTDFTATHFYPSNEQHVAKLWVSGPGESKDDFDDLRREKYNTLVSELDRLVAGMNEAYKSYRAIVRTTLLM